MEKLKKLFRSLQWLIAFALLVTDARAQSLGDRVTISSTADAQIPAGSYLVAPDNTAYAIMQNDGNFCIYRGSAPSNKGAVVWCTDTGGNPASADYRVYATPTGFKVYQTRFADGLPAGQTATSFRIFTRSNGGAFVGLFGSSGTEPLKAWGGGVVNLGEKIAAADDASSKMVAGQYLVSADNKAFALMQDDGNFCVYSGTAPNATSSKVVWCATTGRQQRGQYQMYVASSGLKIVPPEGMRTGDAVIWSFERPLSARELKLVSKPDSIYVALFTSEGTVAWTGAGASAFNPLVGDRIKSPGTIQNNQYLRSADQKAVALMNPDGSFCIYKGSSPATKTDRVWCTETGGLAPSTDYTLSVIQDGGDTRVVVNRDRNTYQGALLTKGTAADLRLVSDASGIYLGLYDSGGNLLLSSLMPTARPDRIQVGEALLEGQYIKAGDGRSFAVMQNDGNFCIYNGSSPTNNSGNGWCTGTGGHSPGQYYAIVQANGDFCVDQGRPTARAARLYCARNKDAPTSNEYAAMLDGGKLRIVSLNGDLWNSATGDVSDAMTIKNYAPFGWQVWVHYFGCDTQWMHVLKATDDGNGNTLPGVIDGKPDRKPGCLITQITKEADQGAPTVSPDGKYMSSGTSYRTFYIVGSGSDAVGPLWLTKSEHELSGIPNQGTGGKSPGFAITNNTKWPVAVAIEQAGCLYHDVLGPGKSMNRNTGAVWFTITAQIVPDGKDPNTDLSCAIPVVQIVAAVLQSALMAGVPGWLSIAGFVVGITGPPAVGAMFVTQAMVQAAAQAAGVQLLKAAVSDIAEKYLDKNRSVKVLGQYAGYDWPFRCDQKPKYEITGGWGNTGVDPNNGNFWIDPGAPLKIRKVNDCGDDMMKGSKPQ